jgi:hypothetical protein
MSTLSVAADDVLAAGPREQRLSWPLATGVAVLPLVIAGASALAAQAGYVAWFAEEDGPAENLQFVMLMVAAAGATAIAVARGRRGERLLACLYAGLAGALVFLGGEEISWGQRIFGLVTPPALAERSIQGELNLHNTFLLTRVFEMAQLVGGLLVAVLLVVPRPKHLFAHHEDFISAILPHPALAPYFASAGLWRLYRVATGGHSAVPWVAEYGEIIELIVYLGFLLFVAMQLAAVRALDPPAPRRAS